MSEKKSENAVVRFFRGIAKPFGVIPRRFNEVRHELKRVIWPTKEKLVQLSAIVLVVILAFAVYLTFVSKGTNWILEKVGFYVQIKESTVAPTITIENTTAASSAAATSATTASATTAAASTESTGA